MSYRRSAVSVIVPAGPCQLENTARCPEGRAPWESRKLLQLQDLCRVREKTAIFANTLLRFHPVAALPVEDDQEHGLKIQGKVVVKMVLGKTNSMGPSAGHPTNETPRRNAWRGSLQAAVAAPFGSGSRQVQAGHGGPGITAMDATPVETARQRDGLRWAPRLTGTACGLTQTTPTAGAKPGDIPTPLSLP